MANDDAETLDGGAADGPARAGGRDGHRRAGAGRDRLRGRRGVLQYGDDGVSGDPHRSVLCRPDHHFHLPAYRQRRHQPRGYGNLQPGDALRRARLRAAGRGHRALQLPRRRDAGSVAEGAGDRRRHRRRHACAHGAHPREGHAQRRHRARALGAVRPRQAQGRGQGLAGSAGPRPGARGDRRPELHLGRDALGLGQGLRPAGGARSARGGRRLRAEAQHPALPGYGRLQGDGRPGHRQRGGDPGAQARRGVPLQWSGRSRRHRQICGARDQEARRRRGCRCSASASATRCSGWRSAARRGRCTRATTAPITP